MIDINTLFVSIVIVWFVALVVYAIYIITRNLIERAKWTKLLDHRLESLLKMLEKQKLEITIMTEKDKEDGE